MCKLSIYWLKSKTIFYPASVSKKNGSNTKISRTVRILNIACPTSLTHMAHSLDLRGITCPLNFVKTKLCLDKLGDGDMLTVLLDAGEPIESVYSSVLAEGHNVEAPEKRDDGSFILSIKKVACA
jgi:TusA-related sulfurtransferase